MVAGSYHPHVGGGELLNARHARLLREAGYDVRVLVGRSGGEAGVDPWGTPYEPIEPRRIAGFSAIPASQIARVAGEFQPSLLYFAGPEPHDIFGLRVASRLRIPAALLYHADFRSDRASSRLATRAYTALGARRFDAVVTTTNAYRQRLLARGLDERRVTCAGMGVDLEFFSPPADFTRDGPARALFVGRLDSQHTYKRLDLLLGAADILARRGIALDAAIVGDGDRREHFEAQARELGLRGVRFLGQVDNERLRAAYRESDLLVLPSPSESEGFGMVVLEAFACGCPAVTHAAAGGSEAVRASGRGAVWEGSGAAALAEAMEIALRGNQTRAQAAAQVRGYVETAHSWNAVGGHLTAALAPLLRQGQSRR